METALQLLTILGLVASAVKLLSSAYRDINPAKATKTQTTIIPSNNALANEKTDLANKSIDATKTRSLLGLLAVLSSLPMLALLQFGEGSKAALNAGDAASIAVSIQLFALGVMLLVRRGNS